MVVGEIPEFSIATGIPAKVTRNAAGIRKPEPRDPSTWHPRMCGIVGIVERDLDRPVAAEDLARMVRMLHHRGPDEEGSITLPGVGLGMRRLAIVDLAGGQQPILNETGDIKIVANGEIYNFRELQQELEGHGHRFHSRHSDIEVLVHAYEQWGEEFLVAAARHVRARDLGRPHAHADCGARSRRREAALLDTDFTRASCSPPRSRHCSCGPKSRESSIRSRSINS